MNNWTINDIYKKLQNPDVNLKTPFSYVNKIKTKNRTKKLSLGKIWFNILLPDDYPLILDTVDKNKINEILTDIYKKYDLNIATNIVNTLNKEAFKLSTVSPISLSIDNVIPSEEFEKLKQDFIKNSENMTDKQFKNNANKLLKQIIKENVQDTPFIKALESGVSGKLSKETFKTLMVSKGYCSDIIGNITKIPKAVSDGYNVKEYYTAASEARNGFYVKTQAVRTPGYLARKATMAAANIKLDNKECKTKKYLNLTVTNTNIKTILNRYYVNDKDETILITKENSKDLINKKINLRSPLYCKSKNGICSICYGETAKQLNTDNIGILAAGALNMVAVNIMMGLRHKSERFEVIDVDFIDILKNSSANISELNNLLDIQKTNIYAKQDNIIIQIDLKNYSTSSYSDLPDKINLPGIINIEFENNITSLPFAFNVDLMKPDQMNQKGKIFTFTYNSGDLIISKDKYMKSLNPELVSKLLDGTVKYITNEIILLESLVKEMPKIGLVHLELLVSILFRDAKNLNKPARLSNYKNIKLVGVKDLPFITGSFISKLGFQDLNKAIKTSLIDENKGKQLSPIDKVMVRNNNYN